MVSIPKIVAVMSCSFLLCLGLSSTAGADNSAPTADEMKADQTDRRQGGQEAGEQQISDKKSAPTEDAMKADQTDRRQGGQEVGEQQISDKMRDGHSPAGKTIEGEVLRVEGDNWFVKEEGGKEVQLHIDQTTHRYPKTGESEDMQGMYIEARVNDQNHALSIRSSDRRNDRHDHSSRTNAEKPSR